MDNIVNTLVITNANNEMLGLAYQSKDTGHFTVVEPEDGSVHFHIYCETEPVFREIPIPDSNETYLQVIANKCYYKL